MTLAQCAVMNQGPTPPLFEAEGINFTHWSFNFTDGWLGQSWLAEATIDADNFRNAYQQFAETLYRITPRIALISQSYIDVVGEPFLVSKLGSDVAFFRYTIDRVGGGLMFMEREKEALDLLLANNDIPNEFFYYWKDAVNTVGYSSKLLVMFSALEALARRRDKQIYAKPIDLYTKILGSQLAVDIFADGSGLRNRLIHGEYFGGNDGENNYLELVHKSVMRYFNEILGKKLISEDIVHPQRHPFGNKNESRLFIKSKDGTAPLTLKDVLEESDGQGLKKDGLYEYHFDNTLNLTY